jgi:hypothetical protein
VLLRMVMRGDSERTCCSIDGGVKEVLLGVCDVEVELWNIEHVEKMALGVQLTGDAVWMTLSNGGSEITALSNAPS